MSPTTEQELLPRYRLAFQDWLACAYAGQQEPAARHVRAVGEGSSSDQALAIGTAGHVLDFDEHTEEVRAWIARNRAKER